jgi:hypothetical protein
MLIDITTFETDNRYYMKYEINGFTYSKRIDFNLYCELDTANKLNELTTN